MQQLAIDFTFYIQGRRYVHYVCDSRVQHIVVGIYYGFKAILQIIALILAFLTRKVKVRGLDDAKYIAAVIYIISLILVVIAICEFTVPGINAFAVVFSTGILLAPTCVLGLLFVPTVSTPLHPNALNHSMLLTCR